MNRIRSAYLATLAVAALAATPAGAASTMKAAWDPSCGATNCFTEGRYTHTWAGGSVSEPTTISQLLLDRSILGDLDTEIFRLSFQVNGQEIGSFGHYMMDLIGGDELSFSGESFTWDPADGDLVLVLEIDPKSAAIRETRRSRSSPSGGGQGAGEQNIVELEDENPNGGPAVLTAAIPEPGAWALMIGGFGLAGAAFRHRRTLLPAQPPG